MHMSALHCRAGGVELQKRDSAMRVNCTLESRLESIFQQVRLYIRLRLLHVLDTVTH